MYFSVNSVPQDRGGLESGANPVGNSMVVFKLDLVGPALAGRAAFLTKKI